MSSSTRSSCAQIVVVGPVAEKSRGLDRGVQAHPLGAGEDPAREGHLHHRLAARDRQAAVKRPQRRREAGRARSMTCCAET